MTKQTGRLTLPTDADIVEETIRLKNLLGADALRDCDGTEMPDALLNEPVKKYATYYTTRKDNAWAEQNPEEIQQEYLISNRVTARSEKLCIRLMEGFHTQQLKVNTLDDPKRWWEVIDRTTGEVVSMPTIVPNSRCLRAKKSVRPLKPVCGTCSKTDLHRMY